MTDPSGSPLRAASITQSSSDVPPEGLVEPGGALVPAERYQIVREVGRGGMGRIYEARDVQLARTVALKMPKDGAEGHLRHEALITARLQHPGIVPVYEAGRLSSGQVFYAMRLVQGRPLDEVISGAASIEQRLGLLRHFIAAAEAIAYAHGEAVVHRDLKPHNVLIGELGEVVVIDWGLARSLADGVGPAHVAGTPAYMAPEQARGAPADRRSDVFALGAMLYHLLSGRAPRDGTSTGALRRARSGEAAPLGALDPATPPDLVAVVHKAMAQEPSERYPDARALAADLVRFETGQLVGAYRYSGGELIKRWLRRHRAVVSLAVLSLAALALIGITSVSRIAQERDGAELARSEAERSRDALLLAQARVWASRDATTAFAWLRAYAEGGAPDAAEVHASLAELSARGVARHVFRGLAKVAPSPDGRHAVLIDLERGGRMALLDVASGRVTLHSEPADDARSFLWSPDGTLVAALSETRLRLFSAARLEAGDARPAPLQTLALASPPLAAAFFPDRRAIALGLASGDIQVLSLAGAATRTLRGHSAAVRTLAITADGTRLLSTSRDGSARLWDPASGRHEILPDSSTARGGAYAVLSGGAEVRVAWVSSDLKVRWRALAGGPIGVLEGHDKPLTVLAFSPDGRSLASGSFDNTVRLWDLASGEARVLAAHANLVQRIYFSPDGRHLLSASLDRDVLIWDLVSLDTQRLDGHPDALVAVAFSNDGKTVLIADGDVRVRVWDVQPADSTVLRGHSSSSVSSMPLDDDHVFSLSDDGSCRLWDLASGAVRVFPTPVTQLGGLTLSADKRWVAAGGIDWSVWLMDTRSGAARVLGGHEAMVHGLAFSRDGRLLASISADRDVKVWDLAGGGVRTFSGHESPGWFVAFSPDGRSLASASDDNVVRVFDLRTGARTNLIGHQRRVSGLAYLPDGRLVTASADTTLRIWDLAGGARVLAGHEALIGFLDVSPDGRTIASASDDRSVRLWDVAGGESRVLAHDAIVVALTFSPDGQRLVSGTNDGAVRVWDLASGHLLMVRRDHELNLSTVSVTPDGRRLVSSSEDMTLRVGSMPSSAALATAAMVGAISSVRLELPAGGTTADARPASPR